MKTVLTTTSTFALEDSGPLRLLERAGFNVFQNPLKRTLTEAEVNDFIAQHQPIALIAGIEPLTEQVMTKNKCLRIISRCGVGLDNIDLKAAERLGIKVFSTPNAPTQAVAELTIGLMLALIRNIALSDHKIRAGEWKKPMGLLLEDLVVGLVGLGRIGKRVAMICRSMGAKTIAADIQPNLEWAAEQGIELQDRDALLDKADIVSLHLPYATGDLRYLIGRGQLARMKRGSYLINTSRGGLVDEQALYESIRAEHLAGAALDTFEREPYTGPLCESDRVILSPHIGSYARSARIRMEREATENAIAGLKNMLALGS